MKNKKLNKRLAMHSFEAGSADGIQLFWGWYWRDIDLNKPLRLAVSSERPPNWFFMLLEARIGKPWVGRQVRICMNNKWGYAEVEATPEQDTNIKAALVTYARSGSMDDRAAAFALMQEVGR